MKIYHDFSKWDLLQNGEKIREKHREKTRKNVGKKLRKNLGKKFREKIKKKIWKMEHLRILEKN